MKQPKTPVTVVSGFLGSGKTTLLRRLLTEANTQLAVIVNDLGELGLDHELVAGETQTPTMRVTELTSGCVCCTLRSELGDALVALAKGEGLARPPEHILIEPSGIARASEVSFAVNALSFEAPVECDAVVTLVDLVFAERSFREHPDLFEDQVRTADLLVLNKVDLVPDLARQQALSAWLRELSPRAQQVFASHAQLDSQLLLGRLDLLGPRPKAETTRPRPHHAPGSPLSPRAHGITAVTLPVPFAVDWNALEDFLASLADQIFRIKGIVDRQNEGGDAEKTTPLLVQAVGDRIDWNEIESDTALSRAPRRLIFIGEPTALDEEKLKAGLSQTRSTK
jgi:cobalamin biosynthesis protein CobW